MRILFTIPHYFKPTKEGFLGSERNSAEKRALCLNTCLAALHQTIGHSQAMAHKQQPEANKGLNADIDVVICTTSDDHVLERVPGDLFRHHETQATPRLLGYECHDVLRQNLGRYDYFCYLEDDLEIADPLFFTKLAWFTERAGNDRLLQPNRFEKTDSPPARKAYIDRNLGRTKVGDTLQELPKPEPIRARVLGRDFLFHAARNPHAGCFFLNAAQMATWAAKPFFLDRSRDFAGPLESAATYGIVRTFKIYKPARPNAGFLEVRHLDHYFLDYRKDPLGLQATESEP